MGAALVSLHVIIHPVFKLYAVGTIFCFKNEENEALTGRLGFPECHRSVTEVEAGCSSLCS